MNISDINFNNEDVQDISLDRLRDRIINQALVVVIIMGFISIIFLIIRAINTEFNQAFYISIIVYLCIVALAIFRKRVGFEVKVWILTVFALIIIISGLQNYGLLASSKIYVAMIPLFVSFLLSYKKTLAILILYVLVISAFSYLYGLGILEYQMDLEEYVVSFNSWFLDITIITLTSLALLYVGYNYQSSIIKQQNRVRQQKDALQNYARMNSHHVRAPLARFMGLINVYRISDSEEEKESLINEALKSAENLDEIIKEMNHTLEKGGYFPDRTPK